MSSDIRVRLVIQADGSVAVRALDGVRSAGTRAGQEVTASLQQAGEASGGLAGRLDQARTALLGMAGAAAAAFATGQIVQAADSYTRMAGQIGLVTDGSREFAAAQAEVFAIAQQTRQPLEATASLYVRLSNAMEGTGTSAAQIAQVTRTVNQALVVSSAGAQEAESAILQLGQAFASGRLAGEEFGAVNEAAPRLLKALAAELGVTRGALKKMAEEGQLTSEVLVRALTGIQAQKIAEEFARLPPTIEQAMTVGSNAVTRFVGEVDRATGASSSAAAAIISGAESLQGLIAPAAAVAGVLAEVAGPLALGAVAVGLGRAAAAGQAYIASQVEQVRSTRLAAAADSARLDMIAAVDAAKVRSIQVERNLAEATVARARTDQQAAQDALQRARLDVLRATKEEEALKRQVRFAGVGGAALEQANQRVTFSLAARERAQEAVTAATAQLAAAERAAAGSTLALTAAQERAAVSGNVAAAATGGFLASVRAAGAGLVSFLGGPWGALVTALTLGATAWALWGDSAEEAANRADSVAARIRQRVEQATQSARAAQSNEQLYQEALREREQIVERLTAAESRYQELLARNAAAQSTGMRGGDRLVGAELDAARAQVNAVRTELQELERDTAQLDATTSNWVRSSAQGFIDVMTAADPVAEAIGRVRDAIRDANAEPVDLKAREGFAGLIEDLKKQEQALREQIASAQGGAAAVAQLRAEQIGLTKASAEQRKEFADLTSGITTLEGRLEAARNANRSNTEATRDAGKAAREAKSAVDEYSAAMRQQAGQDVPAITRAALEYTATLERLDGIRQRLASTRQLTDEREAGLLAQSTRARETYTRAVEQTLATQQRSRAAVDALIPQIRAEAAAIGLSAAERERLSARLRAEDEMRRLVEAAIRDGNEGLREEAAALIANAGAAAEAAAAQGQVAAAAQQAAEESTRYWGGFGDAFSSIVGEGMVNGFEDTTDRLRDLLKRLLADFATQISARQFVIPILTQLGIPTGGMQAGTGPGLLQLLSGGGQGGGGLLGSIGNALGLGGTGSGGFLGNIASTVGGTVRSVLGTVLGIGGGTAAVAGGLGAIGTAGGAAGLGLAGLGGGAAGAGAFAGATAGGAAGLGLMGALSSIASVAGPIALAAVAINALAGGRLFGTSYRTDRAGMQLDIGADGASGYTFEEQSRRRALFQGTRRRTVRGELPDDAQQGIDDLFASIGQTVAAAAGALGIDVPPMIAASFRRTVDKDGKVISEVGSILGRQYSESFETFSRRIAAENVIATIDRALGGTAAAVAESIGDAAGQAFEGGAAAAGQYGQDLESGITTMLKGATTAVQGEASRIAERWRSDADALADGAGMLLAAATDIRRGAGLLGDGSLTAVADLVEDLAREGEPLAGAYARLSAETQLYRSALELMGGSTTMVGEALVRQAAAISEAAGGLERARGLWDAYFSEFYSDSERAQVRLLEAERRRNAALDAIGVDRGISNEEFRRQFEARRDTMSAAETVQWLEAGEAIRTFNAAMRETAQTAGTGTAVDDGLSGRIAADVAAGATGLRGSAEEIGAAVEALRREGESAADAYERLSAGGATLTEALTLLGVAFEGSAAQFAEAANGVSGQFGSLASEFFGSYFSEAEQQARRAEIAQANYAQAVAASGMAAEQLATREQIRAAVMQALADGNTTLAEQLLRVASAFNEVERAAGGAAGSVGNLAGQVDEYGRPVGGAANWGMGGGSGLGFGGGNEGGNAGNGTANELERVREALRNWWRDLTTGPLSPLTPAQQYAESLREWQATAAAAQAGDIEAARRLQSLSDGLLRQAQSYLGPGAAYTQLFNQVRQVVGGVAGVVDAGGGQIRPIDGLGDSAGRAASSLERLASAAGMAPGALVSGLTDTISESLAGAWRSQPVQLPGPRVVQLDRPAPGAQDLARPRPVSRPPVVAPRDDLAAEQQTEMTGLLRQLIRAVENNGSKTVDAIKQRPPAAVQRHLMG